MAAENWHVETGDSRVFIRTAEGTQIASVGCEPYWQPFTQTDLERAHLIAVAPQLRDGLAFVLGKFDELVTRHFGGDLPVTEDELMEIDNARAALVAANVKELADG